MTTFWIISAALLLVALAIIAPSLLRSRKVITPDRNQQNVVIAQEQLTELETDLSNGVLSQEQFEQTKLELEQALLLDLSDEQKADTVTASRAPGHAALGILAVAVPVLTVSLYLYLGTPQMVGVDPASVAHQSAGQEGDMPSVAEMMQALTERLQENPEDAEGWYLLGRTHTVLNNYPQAVNAYERLYELAGDQPMVLLSLADALSMSAQGDMRGRPADLISKAVAMEPNNTTALWLAGMSQEQMGNYSKSLGYLEKLEPLLKDDPESGTRVAALIARVRQKAAATPIAASAEKSVAKDATSTAGVAVRVSLLPEFQEKVGPEESLFVYASALQGPKMPLAAARLKVKDLPLDITLDDSSAMTPQMRLSNFERVVIGARISRSGNAIATSGDLKGEVSPVTVGDSGTVEVVIDQQVP